MDGRRATVHLDHTAGSGQSLDVAANGGRRGAELPHEGAPGDAAMLLDELSNAILSLLSQHGTPLRSAVI